MDKANGLGEAVAKPVPVTTAVLDMMFIVIDIVEIEIECQT